MELKTVYFDQPGQANTDETFRIAKQRADELGIKTVLVASTGGAAAVKALGVFQGQTVIAVSHSTGFARPNTQEFADENRKSFEEKGGILLTAAHTFSGLSRAMRNQFNTVVIGDIVANTLRIFGEGTKVCCEISMMAADAGLVSIDEDIIAMAGTGRGADTAIVLTPVYSHNFFALKIKEILCKPHF